MNYFNYAVGLKNANPYMYDKIYKAVYSSEQIAIARGRYRYNYEEALQFALMHVLANYDPNRGELEHYVSSVVSKIGRNYYRKEFSHDEVVEISIDEVAYKENNDDPLSEIVCKESEREEEDIGGCLERLVPFFVQDYKFMKSGGSVKERNWNLDYEGIQEEFSMSSIGKAISFLKENYSDAMDQLYAMPQKMFRLKYSVNDLNGKLSADVHKVGEYGGIVLYTKEQGTSAKRIYEVDLDKALQEVLDVYYGGALNRKIYDREVYCSLGGIIFMDLEELKIQLRKEILFYICKKVTSFKILRLEGSKALFVSSKDVEPHSVVLSEFCGSVSFDVVRKVSRLVDKVS